MVWNRTTQKNVMANILWIVVVVAGLMAPGQVRAAGGTFPAQPFNGMQITYTVSGANVTGSVDKPDFTTTRTLSGTLGTGTLTVSGSVLAGGLSADVTVTATAGGKSESFRANVKGGENRAFSVAVPIPQGATAGSIQISMTGHYNLSGGQTRGLVVTGTFTGNSIPPKNPSPNPPPQNPSPANPNNPLQFPQSPLPSKGPVQSTTQPAPAPPQSSQAANPPAAAANQPPASSEGTDWKKTLKAIAIMLALSVTAAAVFCFGAFGYAMLTASDIGLVPVLSPVILRIAAAMWTMPIIGGILQFVSKGLLTLTHTGIPTLKLLWQHWGNIKDYLAHNDFWQRHHQQLGNAKMPANWSYDKGTSGMRRER